MEHRNYAELEPDNPDATADIHALAYEEIQKDWEEEKQVAVEKLGSDKLVLAMRAAAREAVMTSLAAHNDLPPTRDTAAGLLAAMSLIENHVARSPWLPAVTGEKAIDAVLSLLVDAFAAVHEGLTKEEVVDSASSE